MNKSLIGLIISSLIHLAHATETVPDKIGKCAETTIESIDSRLENLPKSGTSISYNNGEYQVSYEVLPNVQRIHVGDKVKMCLVKIPENCPVGDDRGRFYQVTHLPTKQTWTLPNSEHSCGGA